MGTSIETVESTWRTFRPYIIDLFKVEIIFITFVLFFSFQTVFLWSSQLTLCPFLSSNNLIEFRMRHKFIHQWFHIHRHLRNKINLAIWPVGTCWCNEIFTVSTTMSNASRQRCHRNKSSARLSSGKVIDDIFSFSLFFFLSSSFLSIFYFQSIWTQIINRLCF